MSICFPTTSNCLIAAGLYISQATNKGFLFLSFLNCSASLPAIVVLPAPWSPTNIITVGPTLEKLILLSLPPIRSVSSSLTILMTCWAGVKLSKTSLPTHFSLTFLTKVFTTLKLTSASNNASFTSLMASLISFSPNLPLPLSFLNVSCNLSAKPSKAMLTLLCL